MLLLPHCVLVLEILDSKDPPTYMYLLLYTKVDIPQEEWLRNQCSPNVGGLLLGLALAEHQTEPTAPQQQSTDR